MGRLLLVGFMLSLSFLSFMCFCQVVFLDWVADAVTKAAPFFPPSGQCLFSVCGNIEFLRLVVVCIGILYMSREGYWKGDSQSALHVRVLSVSISSTYSFHSISIRKGWMDTISQLYQLIFCIFQ